MRPPPGSSSESTWSSVTLPTRIMVLSPSGRPENFVTSTSEAGSYCRNKSTWLIAGVTAESGAWAEESSCEREHPTRPTSIGTAIQDTHDKRLAAIEGPTLYQKVNVGFRATIWGDGSTGFGRSATLSLADRSKVASGRVAMWRGGRRFGLSVAAPFVWRCPSNLAVTPFPHPPGRRGPSPRLPQNVAGGFPALRSSVVASQHSLGLEPPVRQIDLWTL